MKKLIVILLTLCILLPVVAIAERTEWTCPQCGTVCKSVQNFCITDGQPAPWVWTCNACGTERNTSDTCKECGKPQTSISTVCVGDYVTFGHYPQTAAGNDNTPIEWLVLDVQDNKALLLSRYGLDCKPYNSTSKNVTWETCDLRTWLNDIFINQAFTASEQSGIVLTSVDNSQSQGYSDWNTNGGNDTKDKVFLLSYAEANKYLGVTYDNTSNTKSRVSPTAYARANGAWVSSEDTTADGQNAGYWWLRSPGSSSSSAARVSPSGARRRDSVAYSDDAVRPALWVNLESGIFQSINIAPLHSIILEKGDRSKRMTCLLFASCNQHRTMRTVFFCRVLLCRDSAPENSQKTLLARLKSHHIMRII